MMYICPNDKCGVRSCNHSKPHTFEDGGCNDSCATHSDVGHCIPISKPSDDRLYRAVTAFILRHSTADIVKDDTELHEAVREYEEEVST